MMIHQGNTDAKLRRKQWAARAVAGAMAGMLLLQPLLAAPIAIKAGDTPAANITTAAVTGPAISIVSAEPITSGAVLKRIVWRSLRNGKEVSANANVIRIDLQNPHVKLDVLTGKDSKFTEKQTVRNMAKKTGATAAVNGDFFNPKAESAPIGPQIMNGKFMASPSFLVGMYAFALTKDNEPVIDTFSFTGLITAQNKQAYPLSGINKTYYWTEPHSKHSHVDALYMYTDAWGQAERANDGLTTPTEVMVQNGVIKEVAINSAISALPPKDGYILRAAGKAAEFVAANMKVGEKLRADYELLPTDSTKTYDTRNFKTMIGGHTILVDEGKPAKFSRNVNSLGGYRSRTGIGYSKGGQYVYLITVDNRGDSQGMSLQEFQQFMVLAGVWKGMNLDGGGSTQMAVRPLGEFDPVLANRTEYGVERNVVNGFGVYSAAPKGAVKGLILDGESVLFLNQQEPYHIKAYDEYYNPVRAEGADIQWTASQPIGAFEGEGLFTPTQPGEATLTARLGKVQKSIEVEVAGKQQISSMKIDASRQVLFEGGTYKLPVLVTTKKGRQRTVPAHLLQWEFIGFDGVMNGDKLQVHRLANKGMGQLIARYDGFSTMVALPAGIEKIWADFDRVSHPVSFRGAPAETKGEARVVSGIKGMHSDSHVLYLTYDFSQGTGTKAAYAQLGEAGVPVEGAPLSMKMKVLGDNSLNWLRAEVVDAEGKLHRIDIEKHINFYGWKEININLADYPLSYPVVVKRIYVANPEQGQDERSSFGTVAIDDIKFLYEGSVPPIERVRVEMAVGRKSITVGDQEKQLDVAPIVVGGHTLIPVKFFIDAMEGTIRWDGAAKKVTIIKGAHLIELWIGSKEIIVDGEAVTAPIAPTVMSGRTVLPLRLLSEKLGWKVSWNQTTKSIVLE
jgi:exopolysaccharide biosynthesis protein